MLYKEIIAVCSQIYTKHINILCEQNVEFSFRYGLCFTVRALSSRCVCVTHGSSDVYSSLCTGSGDLSLNARYSTSNRLECC
jgi:hypothetical protein